MLLLLLTPTQPQPTQPADPAPGEIRPKTEMARPPEPDPQNLIPAEKKSTKSRFREYPRIKSAKGNSRFCRENKNTPDFHPKTDRRISAPNRRIRTRNQLKVRLRGPAGREAATGGAGWDTGRPNFAARIKIPPISARKSTVKFRARNQLKVRLRGPAGREAATGGAGWDTGRREAATGAA